MSFWTGSICAVHVALDGGKWPQWYLAKITEGIDDNGGVEIRRVRVFGEDFDRDQFVTALSMCNDARQKAAQMAVGLQWGKVKGYLTKDEIRAAVTKHLTEE